DRFQGLHHRHGVAVGRYIVVRQTLHLLQAFAPALGWTTELDERDLLEKPPKDLKTITALGAVAPGLDEGAVVMIVGGDLDVPGSPALDGDLDASFALMGSPDPVVETELHFLLDIAGEVVGCHPAGMDVEGGFPAVRVSVNDLQLYGVPGRAID